MKKVFSRVLALAVTALAAASSFAKDVAHGIHDGLFAFMADSGLVLGMATFKADAYTGKFPVRNIPLGAEPTKVVLPFTLPAAALAVGDIIAIGKVPAGAEIIGYSLVTEDADTGATPTLAVSLGSLNSGLTDIATAYQTGLTVLQTGGTVREPANSVAHFTESSTAERSVGLKVTAAAATYAASKKGLLVLQVRG